MTRHSNRSPCDFCGANNSKRKEANASRLGKVMYWVECLVCGARGPRSENQAEIDRLWNARIKSFDAG